MSIVFLIQSQTKVDVVISVCPSECFKQEISLFLQGIQDRKKYRAEITMATLEPVCRSQ